MTFVEQVKRLLAFANTAVGKVELTAVHPPVGDTKLNTFIGGLETVQASIVAGNLAVASNQLSTGLALCDGKGSPADLVEGTARAELADLMQALITAIDTWDGVTDNEKWAALKVHGRL